MTMWKRAASKFCTIALSCATVAPAGTRASMLLIAAHHPVFRFDAVKLHSIGECDELRDRGIRASIEAGVIGSGASGAGPDGAGLKRSGWANGSDLELVGCLLRE
jgi:hypothetical protein